MPRERINIAPTTGTSRTSGTQLTETLTGARTITVVEIDTYPYITFDPGGAARTVTLPAEAASIGAQLLLKNSADAAEIITVNDDSTTLVCTLTQSESVLLWCDGTTWNGGALPETVGAVAPGEITLATGSVLLGTAGVAAALDAKGDTKILVGNASTVTSVAVSGDATLANTGALTIGAGVVDQAMLAAASLDGTVAKVAAAENVIGAIPVVHVFNIDGGVDEVQAITLTHKTRILDAWCILEAAGTTGSSFIVQNAGTAISDDVDTSGGGDKAVFRVGTMDTAQQDVAAAAALQVNTTATGDDNPVQTVYVLGLRVA